MSEQFTVVRYVTYDKNTFRPIGQGSCQQRDYQAHKDIVVDGTDIVLLEGNQAIDLNPYDHIFGACDHAVDGVCPITKFGAAAIAGGEVKTAADAITRIDQLNIVESWKFVETSVTCASTTTASLTIT